MTNTSTNQYLNKTILENDPFVSITDEDEQSFTNTTGFHKFLDIHEAVTKGLGVSCCLIASSAYMFLIITICRFKKLRSSTINLYILNTSTLYVINTPMTLLNLYGDLVSRQLVQTSLTVLILYMTFAFLLGLNWLVVANNPYRLKSWNEYQKFLIGSIYGLAVLEWSIGFWYAREHHIIRMHLLFYWYLIVLIGSIILNIVKKFLKLDSDSSKTSYAFTCSNLMVFSLVPLLLYHFLFLALEYSYFIVLLSFIPELFFIIHPVIIVYVLGKRSKQFRIAYCKSLMFLRQSYNGKELDESASDGVKVNDIQVNFSASDELLTPRALGVIHEVDLH